MARNADKVVGIEYVPEAIEDAKLNSRVNGIDNTLFYAGDMKDMLTDAFIAEHGRPDVMIIDPPRAGMHQDVVDTILRAEPASTCGMSAAIRPLRPATLLCSMPDMKSWPFSLWICSLIPIMWKMW